MKGKDGSSGATIEMTLDAKEFMARWLRHVLPKGFVRIRYYGLCGGNQRKAKLARCRELLGQEAGTPADTAAIAQESYDVFLKQLTGIDVNVCPVCGKGRMCYKRELEAVEIKGGRLWHAGVEPFKVETEAFQRAV